MKLKPGADEGYSMIELLIVVALIVVMAAVGLPNLMGYLRQAKVRGAMQQVAGEMQTARNKAIVKNTTQGVAFAVLDADTYRFFVSDDPAPDNLGTLQHLPQGVTFVPAAQPGFAFNRLGGTCPYGGRCLAAPNLATLCPDGETQCTNNAPGNYVADVGGTMRIEVIENATQLRRWVQVAPGGRVETQR